MVNVVYSARGSSTSAPRGPRGNRDGRKKGTGKDAENREIPGGIENCLELTTKKINGLLSEGCQIFFDVSESSYESNQ